MYNLVRTSKKVTFKATSLYNDNPCLYDVMYRESIRLLAKHNGKAFKFKNDVYNLVDQHLRNSGICNPENHLGQGNQTSKTLVNKAIQDGYIRFDKVQKL